MQILRDHCRPAWLWPQPGLWLQNYSALGSGKDFPLIAVSEAFENMTGFKRTFASHPLWEIFIWLLPVSPEE